MTKVRENSASELNSILFRNPQKQSKLLAKYVESHLRKYQNDSIQNLFDILPYKFISICPMSLCNDICDDINFTCSADHYAALGFLMFGISMHDDVVDEMYSDQGHISSLLFSGNIAANEGILLLKNPEMKVTQNLLTNINKNHFYQNYNIETLWLKKPKTFLEYIDGLKHDIEFVRIGLEFGLSISSNQDMYPSILDFSKYYGYAIQLLDDMREADEDKQKGYNSYPTIEGRPYAETYQNARQYAEFAYESLPENLVNLKNTARRLMIAIDVSEKEFV